SRQLSWPAELGLDGVDAAGGGRGAGVDDSSARFNSASISSAFTCRFGAPCMARSPSIPLTPERALPPVASRRSFAIESGTRPLIAARAACPQAPARQPEEKALYSERCWWTCRWRAPAFFVMPPDYDPDYDLGVDLARPRIAAAKRRRASVPVGSGRFAGRRQVIGLDHARHPDHQRLAAAIERLARRRTDPALAHAIFLDIAPLDAAKADANAAQERRFVIKRTRRVD